MSRTITLIAVIGAALALAVPVASGKGQPVESQEQLALQARSEGLNKLYGLGEYSPEARAERLRSQGMNERYGLGAYPPSAVRIMEARDRVSGGGNQVHSTLDAREESFAAKRNAQLASSTPPDLVERAVRAQTTSDSSTIAIDARERAFGAKREAQLASGTPPDLVDRAVRGHQTRPDGHFLAADDRFRLDPTTGPVQVSATDSGREIDWPQIGIGLGIGIALMLGLMLAVRVTRHRPLAH